MNLRRLRLLLLLLVVPGLVAAFGPPRQGSPIHWQGVPAITIIAREDDRVLVAIKNGSQPPLTLPNVLHNVVAHEIGHALGLQHNGDPTTLMCGRPASCRPAAFTSEEQRMFPLTGDDIARLRELYPANWHAR